MLLVRFVELRLSGAAGVPCGQLLHVTVLPRQIVTRAWLNFLAHLLLYGRQEPVRTRSRLKNAAR
jgi:hypothetical protein